MDNYLTLYSEYQKLQKENEILKESLGYYANPDKWEGGEIEDYDISLVRGNTARIVLGELYQEEE